MRKKIKNQINNLVETLLEAFAYLKKVSKEEGEFLYCDCILALETIKKELHHSLLPSSIEQYKELFEYFDRVCGALKEDRIEIDKNFYIEVEEYLLLFYKLVQLEEITYEIVFLPYNISMWDSLESIWKAAKKDPRCNARVIPIPYYYKKEDGTLGEEIYDIEEYPSYVPVEHYLEYDIMKEKPDIIYFHNGYDRFNKITSVHPLYYSNKLREYTDLLVYVPYFLVYDSIMEDFAIIPGVENADYVIVQSEDIASQYKKYYLGKDKEKFLPLGSPKIDKSIEVTNLYRIEREQWNQSIARNQKEEWFQKIKNKKVIFYNNHLTTMVKNGEEFLHKLRQTLNFFRSNEDVVLLWRPHPYSEQTIKLVHTELLSNYSKVVQEYMEEGWGIYDNSKELYDAIAVSDGYYGDFSSLICLFEAIKKPILIQELDKNLQYSNEIKLQISFYSCLELGDKLWYFANEVNGLFCYDMKTKKNQYMGQFTEEEKYLLYADVFHYGEQFIFVPRTSDYIGIYHYKTKCFQKIKLDIEKIGNVFIKFNQGLMYEDNLYFIPAQSKALIIFNLKDHSVIYEERIVEALQSFILDKEDSMFRHGSIQIEDKFYLPLCSGAALIEYTISSQTYKIYPLEGVSTGYHDLCYHHGYFYLIPRKLGPIIKCMKKDNRIYVEQKYEEYPKGFQSGTYPFAYASILNEFIYLYPMDANMIIQLNLETGAMEKYIFEESYISELSFKNNPWKHNISSKKLYDYKENSIIYLDENNRIIEVENLQRLRNYEMENLHNVTTLTKRGIMFENDNYRLKNYIEDILEKDTYIKESNIITSYEDVGTSIYEHIRRKLEWN